MKKTPGNSADARGPRKRVCVLVADGGAARILLAAGTAGDTSLEEVARLERASAHQPARALTSDRTGRVFDSGGRTGHGPKTRTRHGAQSDYDPHTVEVKRFAKRLARRLDVDRLRNGIHELVVIAEPRFLGVLRTELSTPTHKLIKREIARDLVRADARLIGRTAFPGRVAMRG